MPSEFKMVPDQEVDDIVDGSLEKITRFRGVESNISDIAVHKEILTSLEDSTVKTMKEYADKEKEVLAYTEKLKILKDKCVTAENANKKFQKDNQKVKKAIAELSHGALTENDQQKLDICKKKLYLYEKCSGVVFDYSHEESVKGFVNNEETNYIKTFCFEKNSNVEKALWMEISKAGNQLCSIHINKSKAKQESKT